MLYFELPLWLRLKKIRNNGKNILKTTLVLASLTGDLFSIMLY